jgi:hypothetical protein
MRLLQILGTTIGILLTMMSCQKSNSLDQLLGAAPIILSANPLQGPFSTVVQIFGSGFTSSDSVQFNGTPAVVSVVSPNALTVIVPKKAGSGHITIQVGGKTAIGPVFNYQFTTVVSTVVGLQLYGFQDGDETSARFNQPIGICLDNEGNIDVADYGNDAIRQITLPSFGNAHAQVRTLAGSPNSTAEVDGNGEAATFLSPYWIAVDASQINGLVYVTDVFASTIRTISIGLGGQNTVNTLSGAYGGLPLGRGYMDGYAYYAEYSGPAGIAVNYPKSSSTGLPNVYVADQDNYRIRLITSQPYEVALTSTLAGSGVSGIASGIGTYAQFNLPFGLVLGQVDSIPTLFISDQGNNAIRTLNLNTNFVTTLAGNVDPGLANGNVANAEFNAPSGLAQDFQGNLYVADMNNHCVRKITPAGMVSTLAGSGSRGYKDGDPSTAQFDKPMGIAVDATGDVYVADSGNNCIRVISQE